jgi:Zn-finger nucleic acid-binding protein
VPVSNMQCPVCAVPLVMSERQSVEIDYCPQCRGVWLDRGELDKIIERAATEQPSYSPPQQVARPSSQPVYQQHAHQSGPYYKKRRKSFLEELFD